MAAPQGAYRCQGDDRWCVINITTDDEWEAFCGVLGKPEWIEDPKFATFRSRVKYAGELDALIEEWAVVRSAEEVMHVLQSAGVEAGVVQNGKDVTLDPQLAHRQHYLRLPHTAMGTFLQGAPAFRFSDITLGMERSAPCLSEHNELFYTKMLGMNDEEFVNLLIDGVFD